MDSLRAIGPLEESSTKSPFRFTERDPASIQHIETDMSNGHHVLMVSLKIGSHDLTLLRNVK